MQDNAADGSVNSSSAAASANGSTGTGAVTAEMRNEFQKVVMGILKDAMPRMIAQSIQQVLPAALEGIKGEANQKGPEAAAAAANSGDSEQKLSLKALHEQIAKLNQGIQERDRRVQEAEAKAREVRLRSEVTSQFARHLGADSPHLTPYVNHFL